MNYVDVLVTLTSLVEVAFVALVLPMNPTLFRLLRIGIWELQGGWVGRSREVKLQKNHEQWHVLV